MRQLQIFKSLSLLVYFDMDSHKASGGGTSGSEIAFCLGRPGLNPRSDFGFSQVRIAVILFSLRVGLLLKSCNRTVHTLPSSNKLWTVTGWRKRLN